MSSFVLIRPTVWPQCTYVTDRQRTDRIGRTILQTVAQQTEAFGKMQACGGAGVTTGKTLGKIAGKLVRVMGKSRPKIEGLRLLNMKHYEIHVINGHMVVLMLANDVPDNQLSKCHLS